MPEVYAEQMLVNADGSPVRWWHMQVEIARALIKYKRVFVKASHSVGKTHLAGGLVNWFFDCFNPGITLTTAPGSCARSSGRARIETPAP